MIASPVSPSASKSPKTRTRSPAIARGRRRIEHDRRVREPGRVVETLERIGEPGDEVLAGHRAAGGEQTRQARRDAACRGDRDGRRPTATARPGRSSGSGVRPRRQDAMRGCTADLPARRVVRPQDAVRRTRGLRAVVMRPCRRSSQSCQSTSSGAATKIDE